MRFAALRNRDYALFWGSHVLSRMGSEMRMVAFSWHVYVLTGSKLALGVIGLFRCLPVLVFGLWGGVTADRLDRRRVLIVTQVCMAVVSTAMFLVTRAGLATPYLIYGAVGLIAAAAAFENPARAAFIVNILPKEDLENGLALNVTGWQTATVVGPALGGVLLEWTSIPTLYLVDAISFVPLIGVLFVIRALIGVKNTNRALPASASPDTASSTAGGATKIGSPDMASPAAAIDAPRPTEPPKSGIAAIVDAVRYLRTKPVLLHLMWIDFLATLFAGALLLLPVFAKDVYQQGAHGLGWLMSAPAVGAVIAGGFLSSRPPIRRHGRALLGAVIVYGISTALFGLSPSFALGLVLLAVSGAADAVSTVVRQIARQTMIPDEMRGRLNAIHMLFFVSGPQLGELEAGAVAQLTSARVSVVSGGVACLLLGVIVSATVPSVRDLTVAPPKADLAKG